MVRLSKSNRSLVTCSIALLLVVSVGESKAQDIDEYYVDAHSYDECTDGYDNDGDGFVDELDLDCVEFGSEFTYVEPVQDSDSGVQIAIELEDYIDSLVIEIADVEIPFIEVAEVETRTICKDADTNESPYMPPTDEGENGVIQYVVKPTKKILALIPGPSGTGFAAIAAAAIGELRTRMDNDPFFHMYTEMKVITWPASANETTIAASVESSLRQFVNSHGECVQLDLLTHSLGGFVGLLGATRDQVRLDNGKVLSEVIGKYVTLAGATQGQNPNGAGTWDMTPFIPLMGRLQPYRNQYVQTFLAANAGKMANWDKCSLWSDPGDMYVMRPYNSGCIPGARCFTIATAASRIVHFLWIFNGSNQNHEAIHNAFYAGMKSSCWNNPAANADAETESSDADTMDYESSSETIL